MSSEQSRRILDKIQKCLALSESNNEAEAAAALRQAQKLMAMHNLNSTVLELHTVSEAEARCTFKAKKLAHWVSALRWMIADVFQVSTVNRTHKISGVYHNSAVFLGVGEKPQVAQYTYEVLYRQLAADRVKFAKTLNSRLKKATKTNRCDHFCMAWVSAVRRKVELLGVPKEEETLIDRFKEVNYSLKPSPMKKDPTTSTRAGDIEAMRAGRLAGSEANVFRGVGAKEPDRKLS